MNITMETIFPLPWSQDAEDASDIIAANQEWVGNTLMPELARQITACVNACEGLDVAKLEEQSANGKPLWLFVQDLCIQREQLLNAIKEAREEMRIANYNSAAEKLETVLALQGEKT